jgi:hypothetical protein
MSATYDERQQATVKFAEEMGWHHEQDPEDRTHHSGFWFWVGAGGQILVTEGNYANTPRRFNPWDNEADATELAEKLFGRFELIYDAAQTPPWDFLPVPNHFALRQTADTLCEAICLAALSGDHT